MLESALLGQDRLGDVCVSGDIVALCNLCACLQHRTLLPNFRPVCTDQASRLVSLPLPLCLSSIGQPAYKSTRAVEARIASLSSKQCHTNCTSFCDAEQLVFKLGSFERYTLLAPAWLPLPALPQLPRQSSRWPTWAFRPLFA